MAAGLHLRVPDAELAELQRLARKKGPDVTVSAIVRDAISRHIASGSGRSSFFRIFAPLVEDLADNGVRPILVGAWAAAAHGYLTPCDSFDLVVREQQKSALRSFLKARGIPGSTPLPVRIGRTPWCVTFALDYAGRRAPELATQTFSWDEGALETLTLDAVLALGPATLPDYAIDALQKIKAGHHELDDGERGVVAWDAVGRLTASAWYPDPKARGPHKFLDFRKVRAL